MAKFKKLPIPVKIELITNEVISRLNRDGDTDEGRLITKEGSQPLNLGEYLVTGVKGELYAIPDKVFAQYEAVPGRADYYTKRGDVVVDAIRVDYPADLHRPDWDHSNGAGGYLIFMSDDDQYFCDASIMLETYAPLDEAAEKYLEITRKRLSQTQTASV